MTFAAVATTAEVAERISRSEARCMMHGPTFMGNPLACAVAVSSTRLLLSSPWEKRIAEIESIMREELEPARKIKGVRDLRVLGGIGVVEVEDWIDVGEFQKRCVEKGVWIRPFGHNAYIMPPFMAITDDQLRHLCRSLLELLSPVE